MMKIRQRRVQKYLYMISVILLGVAWCYPQSNTALACHISSLSFSGAQCVSFLQNNQPVPNTYSCAQGAEISLIPTLAIGTGDAFKSLSWLLDGASITDVSDVKDLPLTYTLKAAGKHTIRAILSCTSDVRHGSDYIYPIVNFTLTIIPHDGVKVVGTTGTGDGILCEPADKGTSRCQETYSGLQGAGVKAIVVKQGAALLGWKVNGKFVTPEEFMQMVTGQ